MSPLTVGQSTEHVQYQLIDPQILQYCCAVNGVALTVISANVFVPLSPDRAARSVDGDADERSSSSAMPSTASANPSVNDCTVIQGSLID